MSKPVLAVSSHLASTLSYSFPYTLVPNVRKGVRDQPCTCCGSLEAHMACRQSLRPCTRCPLGEDCDPHPELPSGGEDHQVILSVPPSQTLSSPGEASSHTVPCSATFLPSSHLLFPINHFHFPSQKDAGDACDWKQPGGRLSVSGQGPQCEPRFPAATRHEPPDREPECRLPSSTAILTQRLSSLERG